MLGLGMIITVWLWGIGIMRRIHDSQIASAGRADASTLSCLMLGLLCLGWLVLGLISQRAWIDNIAFLAAIGLYGFPLLVPIPLKYLKPDSCKALKRSKTLTPILPGLALVFTPVVHGGEQPVASEADGFGWELVAILFVVGMALSIFHSISMLRKSSKPGPAYWVKMFEQACSRRDPRQAEQALIFWAKSVWGGDAPDTLYSLARKVGEGEAGQQILALKTARDGSSGSAWNAYLCRQVLAQRLQQISVQEEKPD